MSEAEYVTDWTQQGIKARRDLLRRQRYRAAGPALEAALKLVIDTWEKRDGNPAVFEGTMYVVMPFVQAALAQLEDATDDA